MATAKKSVKKKGTVSFTTTKDPSGDPMKYLEMINHSHQEHLKNTQNILGKMMEVNNNLASIISNNMQVNNAVVQPVASTSTQKDLDSGSQQHSLTKSYPKLR